jgi:hypothetical protein
LITTGALATEVQPNELVTVKVYVPAARSGIVVLVPDPLVCPPGDLVSVQLPAGSPFSSALPVATAHVGCVIIPIVGAVGPVQATVPVSETNAVPEPAKVELPDETFTLTLVTSIPSLSSHIRNVNE